MNTQSPLTILACMHELTRSGKSLSTTAVVALFAYAQPFGHAADQLLETAVLLAFLLLLWLAMAPS